MAQASSGSDPDRASLLFRADRPRIGWVFEDPWQTFRRYPEPEPVPTPDPDPDQRERLEREVDRTREDLPGLAGGGCLVGTLLGGAIGLVACLWGVIADDDIHGGASLGDSLLITALIGVGVLALAATAGWFTVRNAQTNLAEFERRRAGIRARNAHDQAAWDDRRRQHEARERDRIEGLAEWRSQELPPTIRRLDVFGGTHWGWEGLITVFGASVIGVGAQLTVVDMSRSSVSEDLNRLARQHGHNTRTHRLPDDLPQLDPFAGMDAEQVVDTLVDLVNSDNTGTIDHHLLTEICAALGERITINRIFAAVRVAAGQRAGNRSSATDRTAADPGPLTREERRHIAEELFTDSQRQSVILNLQRIESALSPFRRLSERDAGDLEIPEIGLLSIVTRSDVGAVRSRLINDLLVRWLTHKVSIGAQRPGSTLLIAGADDIAADPMERLAKTCDRRGVYLVTLYNHLRRDPRQTIGGGAVACMRLDDDTDAVKASQFIGQQHRFVLSQLTDELGRSESLSVSGPSEPYWDASAEQTIWTNRLTWTANRSRSNSRAHQRVYEYAVEPTTLQSIPEYALLLVTHEQGDAVVQAVECSPAIVLLDKFLPAPQRIWAAASTDADRPAVKPDPPSDNGTALPPEIPAAETKELRS
jgi:hypothetical protein